MLIELAGSSLAAFHGTVMLNLLFASQTKRQRHATHRVCFSSQSCLPCLHNIVSHCPPAIALSYKLSVSD